mgnify:CR=1 FL=1
MWISGFAAAGFQASHRNFSIQVRGSPLVGVRERFYGHIIVLNPLKTRIATRFCAAVTVNVVTFDCFNEPANAEYSLDNRL